VQLKLSEAASVELAFAVKKGKTLRLRFKGNAGRNTLKVKRGKLAARRYTLTVLATDKAGNRSRPAVRRLTVRP
jgi:hypothetical protein